MNASDSDAPADLPLDPTAEAPAPKRRRSPAKAADVAAPAADEGAPPVKRTRRKASGEAAEAAPDAPDVVPEAVEALPKKRASRKKAAEPDAAEAPVVEAAGDARPMQATPAVAHDVVTTVAQDGEGAGDDEGEGAEGEADDEGNGRRRNRRRNRKERAERLAAAIASGEVQLPVTALTPEVAAATGARFEDVLSGGLDAESASAEDLPVEIVHMSDDEPEEADSDDEDDAEGHTESKRVLAPEPDAPKLQKVLAQSGIGSRRDIENWIAEGRIEVNGEVAHVGQRVSFGDQVRVNGKPVRVRIAPPNARILAYHKPTGEVSTFHDPEGRPTVFRSLPKVQGCKWQSVGRLDINTEGLLLFTNSGELANQLMHPRFGVEREYAARVLGTMSEEQRAKLLSGVSVDGQVAAFRSITDGGGEGANRWYRVVITEGRNREVRKLFEAAGMVVNRLIRIRYGTVVLPRGLKRGVWVELGEADVRVIKRLAGGPERERAPGPQQGKAARDDRPAKPQRDRRPDRQAGSGPRPSRPPERIERDRFEDRPPRQERSGEDDDDFIPHHINPLEQTFDRRHANNKQRGFPQGFGAGGSGQQRDRAQRGGGGGPREPDPMQTSMGYIGGDAFLRRNKGGKGGGGGGGRSGGGFGGRHR